MRTRSLESPEATELAKLTETTYFGLLIAFAQDVDRLARRVGAPYEAITSFYDEMGYLPTTRFFPGIIGGPWVRENIARPKRLPGSPRREAVEGARQVRQGRGGGAAARAGRA